MVSAPASLAKRISRIRDSSFARHVLTLASGTTAAQAVTILAAPLLARLYLPQYYGAFALWSATVSFVALFASGRYEGAILLTKEDSRAVNLIGLSIGLTLLASLLAFGVLLPMHATIAAALGAPELGRLMLLIPFAVVLTNTTQSLSYWANRQQGYRSMAGSRIVMALMGTATTIACGFFVPSVAGLVAGTMIGQFGGLLVLAWHAKDRLGEVLRSRPRDLKSVAREYADFPRYSLWSDLMNVLSNQLVVVMLSRLFGVTVLGWFSMGQRVIGVPSNLIGTAVLEVFRGRASRDYAENGNCRAIFEKTLKQVVLLSLVPFVVLLIAAPELFAFILGEKWRMAGEFARVMSIMFVLRFVVSPLTHTFFLAKRQREDLLLHIWILVSSIAALALGYWLSHDAKTTLLCFSLNFGVIYGYYLWRSHRLAAGLPS